MRRVVHWERRLADWHVRAQTQRFSWGEWDCALAAASAVEAMTDEDPAAEYRGRYEDEDSAAALLAEIGGLAGLMERLSAARGWPEVPVRFAQRGDVILADFPMGPTLGVCVGRGVVFPARMLGLVTVSLTSDRLTRAWRIG